MVAIISILQFGSWMTLEDFNIVLHGWNFKFSSLISKLQPSILNYDHASKARSLIPTPPDPASEAPSLSPTPSDNALKAPSLRPMLFDPASKAPSLSPMLSDPASKAPSLSPTPSDHALKEPSRLTASWKLKVYTWNFKFQLFNFKFNSWPLIQVSN
jgi:hypothetical protein